MGAAGEAERSAAASASLAANYTESNTAKSEVAAVGILRGASSLACQTVDVFRLSTCRAREHTGHEMYDNLLPSKSKHSILLGTAGNTWRQKQAVGRSRLRFSDR